MPFFAGAGQALNNAIIFLTGIIVTVFYHSSRHNGGTRQLSAPSFTSGLSAPILGLAPSQATVFATVPGKTVTEYVEVPVNSPDASGPGDLIIYPHLTGTDAPQPDQARSFAQSDSFFQTLMNWDGWMVHSLLLLSIVYNILLGSSRANQATTNQSNQSGNVSNVPAATMNDLEAAIKVVARRNHQQQSQVNLRLKSEIQMLRAKAHADATSNRRLQDDYTLAATELQILKSKLARELDVASAPVVQNLAKENEDLIQEVKKLKTDLEWHKAQESILKSTKLKSQIERMKHELATREPEQDQIKSLKEQRSRQRIEHLNEVTDRKRSRDDLKDLLREREASLKGESTKYSLLKDEVQKQSHSTQRQIDSLMTDNMDLQEQLEVLEKEKGLLEQRNEALEASNSKIVDDKQEEIKKLQREKQDLKSAHQMQLEGRHHANVFAGDALVERERLKHRHEKFKADMVEKLKQATEEITTLRAQLAQVGQVQAQTEASTPVAQSESEGAETKEQVQLTEPIQGDHGHRERGARKNSALRPAAEQTTSPATVARQSTPAQTASSSQQRQQSRQESPNAPSTTPQQAQLQNPGAPQTPPQPVQGRNSYKTPPQQVLRKRSTSSPVEIPNLVENYRDSSIPPVNRSSPRGDHQILAKQAKGKGSDRKKGTQKAEVDSPSRRKSSIIVTEDGDPKSRTQTRAKLHPVSRLAHRGSLNVPINAAAAGPAALADTATPGCDLEFDFNTPIGPQRNGVQFSHSPTDMRDVGGYQQDTTSSYQLPANTGPAASAFVPAQDIPQPSVEPEQMETCPPVAQEGVGEVEMEVDDDAAQKWTGFDNTHGEPQESLLERSRSMPVTDGWDGILDYDPQEPIDSDMQMVSSPDANSAPLGGPRDLISNQTRIRNRFDSDRGSLSRTKEKERSGRSLSPGRLGHFEDDGQSARKPSNPLPPHRPSRLQHDYMSYPSPSPDQNQGLGRDHNDDEDSLSGPPLDELPDSDYTAAETWLKKNESILHNAATQAYSANSKAAAPQAVASPGRLDPQPDENDRFQSILNRLHESRKSNPLGAFGLELANASSSPAMSAVGSPAVHSQFGIGAGSTATQNRLNSPTVFPGLEGLHRRAMDAQANMASEAQPAHSQPQSKPWRKSKDIRSFRLEDSDEAMDTFTARPQSQVPRRAGVTHFTMQSPGATKQGTSFQSQPQQQQRQSNVIPFKMQPSGRDAISDQFDQLGIPRDGVVVSISQRLLSHPQAQPQANVNPFGSLGSFGSQTQPLSQPLSNASPFGAASPFSSQARPQSQPQQPSWAPIATGRVGPTSNDRAWKNDDSDEEDGRNAGGRFDDMDEQEPETYGGIV